MTQAQQAFVKFFGHAANRSSRHAVVGEIVAESGCNWACTYPATRRPKQVCDGDVMYMGRLVSEPNDIMVFGRAIASAHQRDVDVASEAEIARRPWKRRWSNYVRVHDAEFIDGRLDDGISLQLLMAELGSDAFTSTQANARRGVGNTEPSRSIMQKPHMRLTGVAREWLDRRFEERAGVHGLVDLSPSRFSSPAL